MNERKIDKVDYIVISLYLLIGGFIWCAYTFSIIPQQNINQILLALTFAGPFSLFLMYYKRLRIPLVSIIWFCIGFLQWFLVNRLKDNSNFDSVVGTYTDYDLNLLAMMVIFTVFRLLSLLITKQEFMMAAWFSPRDNRKLNFLDYIFTFAGLILITIVITEL
ncbi:MAG: hypothetical protein ACJAS3_003365 [Roseivirga sp.]|jgi:hypothetical protein